MSEIDTQAILDAVSQGQDYTPPEASQAPAPERETSLPPASEPKLWEFNANGQTLKANEDQLLKWASQGYDYSQKMHDFNVKMQEIQQKEQAFSRYQEVDQFAKQNPDWWQHVESAWGNRSLPPSLDPTVAQALQPLTQELAQIKEFVSKEQIRMQEENARREDEALSQEIKSLQTKFPDVDFASRDDSGQSLEYRVIRHANERGIPTFAAAFFDYYQETLPKIYEARGRQAMQEEMTKRRSLGLLGDSRAPQGQANASFKAKNFGDAYTNALRDIGIQGG